MTRLWVRLIRHHRIAAQRTVPCAPGEEQDVLREVCRELDAPTPLWLNKNEKEFETFRHTAFIQDNFVETISFDRMETEYLDDEKKKAGERSRQSDWL